MVVDGRRLADMCVEGWRRGSLLNPSAQPVTTIEYVHKPDKSVRGGRETADHVDILGGITLVAVINVPKLC